RPRSSGRRTCCAAPTRRSTRPSARAGTASFGTPEPSAGPHRGYVFRANRERDSMSTTETRTGGRMARLPARMLDAVERVGNRLPDPLTLFVLLMGLVLLVSWIAARVGAAAAHPETGAEITAINLLSRESVQ